MKVALIDGDILPYEFGSMKELDDEGNLTDQVLPFEISRNLLDKRINQIMTDTGAEDYNLYLTDSIKNFRNEVATIKPYKGQRPVEKPEHWLALRRHLIDNYDAIMSNGVEADDMMACYQMEHLHIENGSVICTKDKDLNMIQGWHYNWGSSKKEAMMWYQDEIMGLRCFYKQLLTGDTSDNILGLYGIGQKSKHLQAIDEMGSERSMALHCMSLYEKYFGKRYGFDFIIENGTLLWMLHSLGNPKTEFYNRFTSLIV